MTKSKLYLIKPQSVMFAVATGYIQTRERAYDDTRKFLEQFGAFSRIQIGDDGYVAFVDFKETPEGWQRDVRGLCYPAHKSGTRQLIRDFTMPVPNQRYLIRTNAHVPTQIEYTEPGYKELQSENIGRNNGDCGFQWIDKHKGPFAFWIPDVAAYVEAAESRGCVVLPYYKNWTLRVSFVEEISYVEWAGYKLQQRLENLNGNKSMAYKNR